jgi:citrate synthase
MAPMTMTSPSADAPAPRGLKGVIVADTELGDVRGREGFYHYRQYSAPELAEKRTFEDVWYLLFEGELPSVAARDANTARIAAARHLPPELVELLPAIAAGHPHPLAALRTALAQLAAVEGMPPTYDADPETIRANALRLGAATPALIAGLHRASRGLPFVAPRDELRSAANYHRMIDGEVPEAHRARAVEQYQILGIDHGFNASTFTARVVTSTGADVGAAVVAALGALSGPLHGGAPSRALDTLDAIGTPDRTEGWVRDAVANGDRIMGFGHAVYTTDDPRSVMLRDIARSLGGDRVEFAVQVEDTVQRVLAELKPGRDLYTNVEFYAGVVMEQCGIPRELFTSTFAASRVVGWCANVLEQATETAIIRPSARYVGPEPPQPVPTAS